MATLIDSVKQTVSVTDMVRSFKTYLDRVLSGDQDRLVLIKNNAPVAVLLTVEAYETIMDELEDLKIEAIAAERLSKLTPETRLLTFDEVFGHIK